MAGDAANVDLGSILAELAPALSALSDAAKVLAPAIEPLEDVFELLTPEVIAVASALEFLAPVIRVVANPLGALKDAVGSVAAKMRDALSAAARAAADVAGRLSSLVHATAEAFAEFVRFSLSMQTANALMGLAASGIQRFTGVLTSGIGSLVNAVTPFISALSPGLAFGLNYAMRSLQATIGTALVPVVNVLTAGIHRLAGILLPAMQSIAPALGSLAAALMRFVQGTFRIFADSLVMLTPLFELLADVSHLLVTGWDAFRAVILAVADSLMNWVKSLFGGSGNMKDFLKAFRDGLHKAIEAILRFTVALSKSLGFTDFQKNLVDNLNKLAGAKPNEPKNGAAPAATDVAFRGFEDFAKTIAQSAFIAHGGGGVVAEDKNEREWLAQLAKSLDEIKDGKTWQDMLADFKSWAITEAEKIGGKVGGWVEGKVSGWAQTYGQTIKEWYMFNLKVPILDRIYLAVEFIKDHWNELRR